MARVRNISTGPRGAYLGAALVMVDPGKETEADDFAPEWFEVVSEGAPKAGEPGDIGSAIDLLDPANDDHWTGAGLPAVDAVKAILGRDVTRAEINEAAPEFMRPTA
ncbi:hypothetical protein [Sphingomonas soli]|uniref:hypothetical protein n=1 Tax=Sphingomonas soli TaxID=266127 RepID=UPI000835136A|nr:hypothetical protein [Sphingomonas soli]